MFVDRALPLGVIFLTESPPDRGSPTRRKFSVSGERRQSVRTQYGSDTLTRW